MENKVTMVITSCNRYELLRRTIYSFLNCNTYPIEKYIIIDDSGMIKFHKQIKDEFGAMFEIICNTMRIGQVKSIDKAYTHVKTNFVFHCEDDWEFYRSGFIEASMKLLEHDPKILQVWLRETNDTNGHPVEPEYFIHEGISYQRMGLDYLGYNGFSFNPGLKRMSDYDLIKPYADVKYDTSDPARALTYYTPESEISQFYAKLGYRAVIMPYGATKHIGWDARVGWN